MYGICLKTCINLMQPTLDKKNIELEIILERTRT